MADLVLPQTVNFKGAPIQQANTPPSGNTLFSQNVNYAYKSSVALDSVGTSMIGGDALSTTNVIDSLSYRAFGKANFQVVTAGASDSSPLWSEVAGDNAG